MAQAGTAISHRMHREPNGYNFIRLERDCVEVAVRRWREGAFIEISRVVFSAGGRSVVAASELKEPVAIGDFGILRIRPAGGSR